MLYPQMNKYRQFVDLSGFWAFRTDPDDDGKANDWHNGLTNSRPIAVPASWNEQLDELRDYTGVAWYEQTFSCPWDLSGKRLYLRFNSVNYLAEVWLNGVHIGGHEGGHLPFALDITDHIQEEDNRLVVRVDGTLAPNRIPPGNLPRGEGMSFGLGGNFPNTNYDFFPYRGIDRPVLLYTVPDDNIADLTVVTEIDGSNGGVNLNIQRTGSDAASVKVMLTGHGAELTAEGDIAQSADLTLTVPDAALWSPDAPNLYDLKVELHTGGAVADSYKLRIGIRTVAVDGDKILLNGEPVKLLGFGRHEDFPVVGKGMLPALIIKDHEIMDWVGANSYRTTHYPYSEQQMQIADELGFLIIDETPAVGLYFSEDGLAERNEQCKRAIRELIARDKNHPSVIMWSIANEPLSADMQALMTAMQTGSVSNDAANPKAVESFREQAELVRELDPTRLVTLVSMMSLAELSFEFMDVVCLNRYHGWYTQGGQIDAGAATLSRELDLLWEKFQKPVLLTEFGADTIPGHHANPPEMFSEEYQAEFITAYVEVMNGKSFVAGQHVWNLADFKTSQGIMRVNGYNHKGVFTRDRRPKLAAHRLRQLWKGE